MVGRTVTKHTVSNAFGLHHTRPSLPAGRFQMTVSILDLLRFNAVCDDHETVESITAEVRRSSHGNVHDEAGECLAEIAAAGLVDFFHFDAGSGRYVPAALGRRYSRRNSATPVSDHPERPAGT